MKFYLLLKLSAFKFYEVVPEEIVTKEQKEKMFKNFMQ